jgi:glycerol-3-phosphate dehydrogenase
VQGVIAAFAGLRAHGDRGDFVLGEPSDAPGFFNAAAIESPGLTAAPALGVWLAERVAERLGAHERRDIVQDAGHWKQFRTMTSAERDEAIRRDPAYGRIICRCETVSEAEVRAAIRCRIGARTLDGVKRRTRAGMGRCQGGFCTPRIVAILCEELGLSAEQVTKFGGRSALFVDGGVPTKEENAVGGATK